VLYLLIVKGQLKMRHLLPACSLLYSKAEIETVYL